MIYCYVAHEDGQQTEHASFFTDSDSFSDIDGMARQHALVRLVMDENRSGDEIVIIVEGLNQSGQAEISAKYWIVIQREEIWKDYIDHAIINAREDEDVH